VAGPHVILRSVSDEGSLSRHSSSNAWQAVENCGKTITGKTIAGKTTAERQQLDAEGAEERRGAEDYVTTPIASVPK
jgi:hypothetical protein